MNATVRPAGQLPQLIDYKGTSLWKAGRRLTVDSIQTLKVLHLFYVSFSSFCFKGTLSQAPVFFRSHIFRPEPVVGSQWTLRRSLGRDRRSWMLLRLLELHQQHSHDNSSATFAHI